MQLFRIDRKDKSMKKINPSTLKTEGFTEPMHLETWVVNNDKEIFDKNIMWITRQDYISSDQRSDLIGIDDSGELIICELKRGDVTEDAVTQALGYAAEYSNLDVEGLSEKLYNHVQKGHIPHFKPSQVRTNDDAMKKINEHVTKGKGGSDIKVNETQTIILVGEGFTPNVLSISDYLNNSSGSSNFVLECWKYELFPISENEVQLGFEQILPPPNILKQIADKREQMRGRKYFRDPIRVEFMRWLVDTLWNDADFEGGRPGGSSYYCNIQKKSHEDMTFVFEVYKEYQYPRLKLPKSDVLESIKFPNRIELHDAKSDEPYLEFVDVKCSNLKTDESLFGKIKDTISLIIKEKHSGNKEGKSKKVPET